MFDFLQIWLSVGGWPVAIGLIIIGFAALVFGADWLVDGASGIAKRLGVSNLVIGLTVVAFGTSMPEFVVNMVAASQHNSEIAITNILGSNIINIFVILGLTAIICPVTSQKASRRFDIPWSLLAAILVLVLAYQGINRMEGAILLIGMVIFLGHSIKHAKAESDSEDFAPMSAGKALLWIGLGLVALVVGGKLIVDSAVDIAHRLEVSDSIIGLTIVALGTSLPELATSCMAAAKKNVDLALGNVIGSNIFNIFFILGTSAVIYPLPAYPGLEWDSLMAALGSALVMGAVFSNKQHQIKRGHGILLLIIYIAYATFRLYH